MLLNHQDRRLISAIHLYQSYRNSRTPIGKIRCLMGKIRYTFWTIVTGSDISRDASIDATVRFPHLNGVVIHRSAVVDKDCLIMQQVTLGQTSEGAAPCLERGVYVGAGAKLLGGVRIGENARIGANAVVLGDVPANRTAVGVPARLVVEGRT